MKQKYHSTKTDPVYGPERNQCLSVYHFLATIVLNLVDSYRELLVKLLHGLI